jgi:hypothetical protein
LIAFNFYHIFYEDIDSKLNVQLFLYSKATDIRKV